MEPLLGHNAFATAQELQGSLARPMHEKMKNRFPEKRVPTTLQASTIVIHEIDKNTDRAACDQQ